MFDLDVRLIWLSNINFTDPEVVAGLPVHFHALVSKGLDPIWIDVDSANDGRDLFFYVHWLAAEKNSLGGEGYSYDVARAAIDFYVRNVHRLIDIPPRRLSLIAKIIKDNPTPAARDERLEQMLRSSDQRPKLILPESWVPVLLWPSEPPRRPDPQPDIDRLPAARQPNPGDPVDPDPAVDPSDPGPAEAVSQRDPDPPPVPSVPETPTQQNDRVSPPSEDRVRDTVDAILDHQLPLNVEERRGAFFGAVAQIEAIGGYEGMEELIKFIRNVITDGEPAKVNLLFAWMTTRAILNQAHMMLSERLTMPGVPEKPPEEQQPQRDPRHTPIGSTGLTDGLDETEDRWDFRPMRPGRATPEDRVEARSNRAAAFQLLGQIVDDDGFVDQAASKLRTQGHRFWRSVSNMTLSEAVVAAPDSPHDPPSDPKANSDDPPAGEPP